ncbi:MAG: hypothetical protein NTX81_00150 [Candidatus Bathyarchaeota archaeon]|nr:hypothetical protein [Candidatus Bathyarchaeota archaeon]
MNTQSLDFKTRVPNEGKGKRPECQWDAWGTSADVLHFNIGTNLVMAYHDFYEFHDRVVQHYCLSEEPSHWVHIDVTGEEAHSDIVFCASSMPDDQISGFIAVGSNYQKMYGTIMASTAIELGQTFSAYPTTEIATLEGLYGLRDRLEVMEFVASNLFLLPLLQQIPEQTRKYFGEPTQLSLEVIIDHEEKNDKELVAFICTSLSPDDAFVRLRSFDRDWWLARLADTRGKLSVHVELQ